MKKFIENPVTTRCRLRKDERGVTLLEVLLSMVVLGIALTGFLMALSTASSTSKVAVDQNKIVFLAQSEFEALRATDFNSIPFARNSDPGHLDDVPDHFRDLAISPNFGGNIYINASGHLTTVSDEFTRDLAFDGKRANFNSRWMGNENLPPYEETAGPPGAGGPGGGGGEPGAGGPGGGPGAGGDFAPRDYQYLLAQFPELTNISRILYDNRFNETEAVALSVGSFDFLPHNEDIWQSKFEFFYSTEVPSTSMPYDPWKKDPIRLFYAEGLKYGSSDVWVIYDDWQNPLQAGVVGVHGIDTRTDFDRDFRWPYVTEIEVYGYAQATAYFEKYVPPGPDAVPMYDVIVMYFPNYLDSGFDMGRITWVEAADDEAAVKDKKDLINVQIEFYPTSGATKDRDWQREKWWKTDQHEVARFTTSFYRDEETRIDRLPNLYDYPTHTVYDNDEDLKFYYTVPGATEIRARFKTFSIEDNPGYDFLTIESADGSFSLGPYNNSALPPSMPWTDWIPGDTIVVHFKSDASGCTLDGGNWGGFRIDMVEVRNLNFPN